MRMKSIARDLVPRLVRVDVIRTEHEWAERAKRFLKAEVKRADVTYDDLAARLARHGMTETKASVANKLVRGAFTATFSSLR